MNDGGLRGQDRQAVVDGSGQGAVRGDGEARDFAEGQGIKLGVKPRSVQLPKWT